MAGRKKAPPKSPPIYVKNEENGDIVARDKSGKELWKHSLTERQRQKMLAGQRVKRRAGRPVKYVYVLDNKGERVLVPTGFDLTRLPEKDRPEALKGSNYAYNEALGGNICVLVLEGYTLREICTMDGFPTIPMILKWFGEHPEFKAQYEEARKAQGRYHADKVHEIAHTVGEDNSKSAKVAMDGFKWLAGVSDPGNYGNKTQITGDKDAPLSFVFNTGIERQEQPAIPVESRELDDEE